MEKVIRDSLVNSRGKNATTLIGQYCRDTVIEELEEMLDEMADIVFLAAKEISEFKLAERAAEKISKSNKYDNESKQAASAYLEEVAKM